MPRGLLILAAGVLVPTPVMGQQVKELKLKWLVAIKERATLKAHNGPVYSAAMG